MSFISSHERILLLFAMLGPLSAGCGGVTARAGAEGSADGGVTPSPRPTTAPSPTPASSPMVTPSPTPAPTPTPTPTPTPSPTPSPTPALIRCEAPGPERDCTTACWLRECGDDGCGGECGSCLPGASCNADGRCECPESSCEGIECGNSSCGRACGECAQGTRCKAGQCEAGACETGSCRDLRWLWTCEGDPVLSACGSDPTKAAICTCDGSGEAISCDTCFIEAPVACHNRASCAEGDCCNAWTGRCEAPATLVGRDNGEPCTEDAQCRSAGGIGQSLAPTCHSSWEGGYCMSYCNPPPGGFWSSDRLEQSNCPDGSVCLPDGFSEEPTRYGVCVQACQQNSDCREDEGYFCRSRFWFQETTNGYCAPDHCDSRGCNSFQCGC